MKNRRARWTSTVVIAVLLCAAALFGAGTGTADAGVRANATIDGRAIAGAGAGNPVRLDPGKVTQVVVEVINGSATPITVRRVDLEGHVLGLNFFSYSTSVELTVAAGKTEKLTYRLDPAGLDGQATGLIGADLTIIGADGKPLTSEHTVIDVRGSLVSVYGLFGIILAVLTVLAIADAALTVARHRLSVNRWQRGLRLLAPGIGLGLMIGFTASVARWWVPGTPLWLTLAGVIAAVFFLAGYLSPTPRTPSDLDLDAEDLAAARELDAHGYPAGSAPDYAADPALGAAPFASGGGPFQSGRAPFQSGGNPFLPGGIPFDSGGNPLPKGSNVFQSGGAPTVAAGAPIQSEEERTTLGYPAGGARSRAAVGNPPVVWPPGGSPPAPPGGPSPDTAPPSGPRRPVEAGEDEPTIRNSTDPQRFRPGGAVR
ncbi:MAG: hypothetical protein JWN03_8764 [Nocardia sp.]|uniref:hypothetical protein n=1 Tax=Nocardia sp. TaxID=1821 RepID=UPI002617E563|nr:hypothetical protein [Nocardia sp.]MCU1648489.1 hypothetical protein [Nocardia sp.]